MSSTSTTGYESGHTSERLTEHLSFKFALAIIFLILAVLSFTKLTAWSVNEDTHEAEIAQIEQEIDMVLKLTAGATGASAVISMLPDDQCTPIAQELAEMGKLFLVVLSALYLEKYLLTLVGYVSFAAIIPVALVLLAICVFVKRKNWLDVALKLMICSFIIYMVIPVSVRASSLVYQQSEGSFMEIIQNAERITVGEVDPESGLIEKFTSWIANAATSIMGYVTDLLSGFVDAIAIMIVSSCLIPILALMLCWWVIKLVFHIDMPTGVFFRKRRI